MMVKLRGNKGWMSRQKHVNEVEARREKLLGGDHKSTHQILGLNGGIRSPGVR